MNSRDWSGRFQRVIQLSDDEGTTWKAPRHDPTAASFTIAIVVAGLVVGMSTLCLVCAHYWTDRWKLKRESGAGEFYVSDNYVAREGDGTAAPATAGHTPADFSFDSFAGGRGTDAEAAAGGAD